MDPLPGTCYFKGVVLVRAPDPLLARFHLRPKDKPKPLLPPVAPLPHPLPPHLRLVSIV